MKRYENVKEVINLILHAIGIVIAGCITGKFLVYHNIDLKLYIGVYALLYMILTSIVYLPIRMIIVKLVRPFMFYLKHKLA